MNNYYSDARNWHYQTYGNQQLWQRRLIAALIVVSALLFTSLLTNLFLFPLKRTDVALVIQDKDNGAISVSNNITPANLEKDWNLTRFFITQYVINRESYDSNLFEFRYKNAYALGDSLVREEFRRLMSPDNPVSPKKQYADKFSIRAQVQNINALNDNTALVTFKKIKRDKSSFEEEQIIKQAVIKWGWSKDKIAENFASINPLNFKVSYYEISKVNENQ